MDLPFKVKSQLDVVQFGNGLVGYKVVYHTRYIGLLLVFFSY